MKPALIDKRRSMMLKPLLLILCLVQLEDIIVNPGAVFHRDPVELP